MECKDQSPSTVRGWVLYDGECAVCAAWMRTVGNILARRRFAVEKLQTPWVNDRLRLSPAELLADIRLLTADGRLHNGADAYLYVMRRIWWLLPAGIFFELPGFKRFSLSRIGSLQKTAIALRESAN